jgi:riboflavin kinase/FMN adenylyltransferase
MNYYVGLENVPRARRARAVTLGAFDGVHRGHHALLQVARGTAAETGAETTVLTFEPTPVEVFGRLGRPDVRLTVPQERRALLEQAGVDTVIVAAFDEPLWQTPPEEFVRDILVGIVGAASVIVSETHTFGRGGSGTMADLMRLGCDLGFAVRVLPLVSARDGAVSSTRIRELLWAGQVEKANGLLGRSYSCRGVVVPGEGRGRQLGYPTANVEVPVPKLVPGEGVYGGQATLESTGQTWAAALVVGASPTFQRDDSRRRLEAHLLDFSGELLGQRLTIAFERFLRPQARFARENELVAQIGQDVEAIRAAASAVAGRSGR